MPVSHEGDYPEKRIFAVCKDGFYMLHAAAGCLCYVCWCSAKALCTQESRAISFPALLPIQTLVFSQHAFLHSSAATAKGPRTTSVWDVFGDRPLLSE